MKEQKEQKTRIRLVIMIAALCIGLAAAMPAHNAMAEDPADDTEAPAFANPAQAQHAANIAEAVAAEPDEATLEALAAVEDAEAALKAAEEAGDEQAIEDARTRLAEAEEAYADVIEARIGVISSDIAAMRDTGMGWGEIARELGVHPSVLGLGHTKARQNKYGRTEDSDTIDGDEVAEATARNTRTGLSQGHGLGLDAGVRETARVKKAYALGKQTREKKSAGGISGASGLSGGQGGGDTGGGKGQGGSASGGGPGKSDKGKDKGGSGKSNGNGGGKGKK